MNQSQKRGFVVLSVLLLVVVAGMFAIWQRWSQTEAAQIRREEEIAHQIARLGDSLMDRADREEMVRRQQYARRKPVYYHRTEFQTQDTATVLQPQYCRPNPSSIQRKNEVLVFDLNKADTLDLQQLRGIGPVFADRIVKYRTLLGGYVSKSQLLEVYGFSTELYNSVAPHLTLDTATRNFLNLNTATLDQLKHHPYLDYYQARAIITYRQKVGRFRKRQDLLKVNLIDEETYQKIKPYIMVL